MYAVAVGIAKFTVCVCQSVLPSYHIFSWLEFVSKKILRSRGKVVDEVY